MSTMSFAHSDASSARSVFRGIIHGTGLYTGALFAQRIGGFITLPIVTRSLTPGDYGISSVLEQVGIVLSLLLGSGYAWSFGYFYSKADSDDERREVIGTTAAGSVMLGLLVAAVCWPFAHGISQLVFKSDLATGYLHLVMAGIPLGFLLESLFVWLRVANRPWIFLWGSLLRLGMTIAGILIFLALLKLRVWGMLYCSIAAAAVTGVALLIYCVRTAQPRFNRRLFASMVRFSIPIGFGAIASFVINFGDQLILPRYISRAELGDYVLAYKIAMIIYAFVFTPFQTHWSAQIFGILKRDDAAIVFARLITYVTAGLSFCAIGLITCSAIVLHVLPVSYRGAAPIIPLIVFAYCARAIGEFVRCIFNVVGRPGYDAATNWLGCLICLAGYFGLIPRWGIWGAAIATAVAFVLVALISLFWTWRLKPYRPESWRLAKIGFATTAAAILYAFIPASSPLAQIAVAATALAAFLGVLQLTGFTTPGEREILAGAIRRLRQTG